MSNLPVLDKPRKVSQFYVGIAFFIAVLVLLIFAWVKISAWLEDEQQAPVKEIIISGERHFIQDQQIESLIKRTQPWQLFELDVEKTHQTVEAMPWVYRASVRKRWPAGLEIYVVEQQPVAIWNGDMLLNQYGDSFNAQVEEDGSAENIRLPRLFGPGGSEQTALQGYRNMQSLLDVTELHIVEMFLSERFAWHLQLNNGVKLNLGRTEFIDRLQRFVDILPLISQQKKQIDYVDLRYDTGLAVGWKASNKAA
ncbi:cell division protein FtsQ/DivIB [Paraglaciecola aquimarina]|uniref:Cell division protein FtsQ n=1 Tax=Paraglaciecola aquimarina TaxID=1235557 RepID=A0ABU3T2F6_9ALTE|nr:cell division protein FtsQ/DivIB [Paraglaciecola aquimarina]MDU0356451.1 cell division protein FtsQ/DivIB [Paraglaciecola aquimarina]